MKVSGNHHGLAVEERLGFDRRAPQDLLREARLAFSRIKLTSHGGMDAVGTNENIGLVGQFGPGISINEANHDLVAALLEAVNLSPLRKFSAPMRSRTARSSRTCNCPRWIETCGHR